MNKCITSVLLSVFLMFMITYGANASLIAVPGYDNVIKDTVSGLYWYGDVPEFAGQTWSEQIIAIENLSVTGTSGLATLENWRFATSSEVGDLLIESNWASVMNLFSNEPNYINTNVWETGGRTGDIDTDAGNPISWWLTSTSSSTEAWHTSNFSENDTSSYMGAWAVTSVPIPGAVWLLGSSFAALAGLRKYFKLA